MHCPTAAFPSPVAMAAANSAHGNVLDRPGITRVYMPFDMAANDHSRDIINSRGDCNLPQYFSGLDQYIIVSVKSIGQNDGSAHRKVIDSVDVGDFKIVKTFYSHCICNEGSGIKSLE